MKNVYIVQDSPGKNLLPAREFGELNILLTGHETVPEASIKLTQKLTSIKATDFLLLVGNPIFIAMAFHVVAEYLNGKINVLVWDREHYKYNVEKVEL